ncbi:MAG: NIPSNAP family protein [Planctomycetaceae bacterium]|nr:NIPSNAP family protein [Planctomycetaceae bacterium]
MTYTAGQFLTRRWLSFVAGWIVFSTVAASFAAEPARWTLSYDSGYRDERGAYAGGSEIMHIVSHQGKLYAANGYWMDAHWVIPPEDMKQSAQVLRLDSSGGTWQVDLEMGKTNGYGLRYMKGNILKSVTFTYGADGKRLPEPVNLLVMAAGATFERGGSVSAWVRDDEKETWDHTIVRHGANAGGIRWVPRDMEVHRDKVTGVERLILLLGNPGVVSGVYDPTLPGKIRWETILEYPFPEVGSVKTRPLGIVQANGSLLFSVDDAIFRRNDGPRPGYTELLRLADDVDTDVGGIRGLTAIKNPNGPGESILFLWAPGGRSTSQVKRLDPDGKGGYTTHDEASMMDLMRKHLDAEVTYTLGAHNMMYPIRHPKTGELVHLIGFQGNLAGKNHLLWPGSRLYGGALYAIRRADQSYSVHEVNNAYAPGKLMLVSPRAFCLSPFGDEQLFIGGHDSSNRISDDMAWICKAPLDVALGLRAGLDVTEKRRESVPEERLTKGPIYELRIYKANEHRFQHLITRFRDYTDRIFARHNMKALGYWIPTDGTPRQKRRIVYVLKHPSRYEAYANWIHFTNDREWQKVLDMPEFSGLLAEKPTSIFMTETDYSEKVASAIQQAGGVYELRTYTCNEGKLGALNDRFRDHTTRLFGKNGMKNIGYWTTFDLPESQNTLIYMVHHESREQADANWKSFLSDPAWKRVARESQRDGKFLAKPPDRIYLKSLEFSPLR